MFLNTLWKKSDKNWSDQYSDKQISKMCVNTSSLLIAIIVFNIYLCGPTVLSKTDAYFLCFLL